MKKSIKFIAVGTVICFIITVTLFQFADLSGLKKFNFNLNRLDVSPEDLVDYKFEQKFKFADTDEVAVNTVAGSVTISTSSDDQIHLTINGKVDKKAQNFDPMKHIKQDGRRITIDLADILQGEETIGGTISEDRVEISFIDGLQAQIQIPTKYKKVRIHTVSADYDLEKLKLEDLDIKTVSGEFIIKQSQAQNFKLVGISSDAKLENFEFQKINIETVSGDIEFTEAPVAFTAEMSSVSGELTGDEHFEKFISGNSLKVGDSDKKISIKTVSGDVHFDQKKTDNPN